MNASGFCRCLDARSVLGMVKLALYAHGRRPSHVARQSLNGRWRSKIGAGPVIEHELEALEGPPPSFGRVVQFWVRTAGGMTAACAWCGGPVGQRHRRGNAKRFCAPAHRMAYHSAVRRYVDRLVLDARPLETEPNSQLGQRGAVCRRIERGVIAARAAATELAARFEGEQAVAPGTEPRAGIDGETEKMSRAGSFRSPTV